MSDENTLRGYVDHVVYRNAENGYTVLILQTDQEEMTAVGTLPELGSGEMLEAHGVRTVHPTYGDQFKISSYEILPPENAAAMERYLGSGIIKGVGKALASRIVKKFKDDTFRVMEQEPEKLSQIKGISPKKAREIAEQFFEKRDQRDAMLFLGRYGISNAMAVRIYKAYGTQIYTIIKENPYRLADEVTGIGFRTADEIARRSGVEVDSHFRVKSAILYILQTASGEGNIYLPREVLVRRTAALLGIELPVWQRPDAEDPAADLPDEDVWANLTQASSVPLPGTFVSPSEDEVSPQEILLDECLLDLSASRKIVRRREEGEDRIYLQQAYMTELKCAQMLHDLNIVTDSDHESVRRRAVSAMKRSGAELDETQMQAVMEADRCGLLILTGGPGTGKTTTINTMISVFEEEGLSIVLAAPTGRAAKRMSEATGYEASTIHRLLEVSGDPEKSNMIFGRDEESPLEQDVIIIDEMSMVDQYLLYSLLRAVPVGAHLIMVGDADQLPSVGPGSVLKDMIASGEIPVVTLTTIFRQAQESDIVVNAHKILAGEYPVISNKSPDFFFMHEMDPNKIIGLAIKLVRDNLPRYVGAPSSDIQVMSPMKKGNLGVIRLNELMQQYLNAPGCGKNEHRRGETVFREGDRVMQVKNNYQISWAVRGRYGAVVEQGEGVFNGDMGIVRRISTLTNTMDVEFDENRYVEYELNDLDQLELAYAVTIHKAQGSEYPAVVIPLLRGPRMLMNRNILYTAVTRARKCVVLIGDESVMREMIDNESEAKRYTSLALRIQECGKNF